MHPGQLAWDEGDLFRLRRALRFPSRFRYWVASVWGKSVAAFVLLEAGLLWVVDLGHCSNVTTVDCLRSSDVVLRSWCAR